MPKIIRINLKTNQIHEEEVTSGHPFEFFAGRSLSSKIVAEEVPPSSDPLGPENKLVFACGFLSGTPCPNSGRISVGAKSPLTGGVKESNVGGRAPAFLGRHDIRALIFEDQSESWKNLVIDSEGNIKLVDGSHLHGKNNYFISEQLRSQHNSKIGIFSIGIAGEKQLNASSIAAIDIEGYPSRHAGRGGMGAVMGSKKLKAIIVEPPQQSQITYNDSESFREVAKTWGKALYKAKRTFSQFGTLVGITTMNSLNALPTQNFRRGSFQEIEEISAETLFDFTQENKGKSGIPCSPGCVIRCSNLVTDEQGNHITSSLEYETVALNGSNLMINSIEKLAQIDHVCDDFGVDTIEMGNAMGVYMETGKIPWGDADKVIEMVKGIETDNPDSLAIANGAVTTGKKFNISRVAQVKGQGIPGYDPRSYKGMGVTFLTSPMGADHTAGAAITGRVPYPNKDYGKIYDGEHKVELSKGLQIFTMLHDSMGQCYFVGPTYDSVPHLVTMLNARYGWTLTTEELIAWGKKWLLLEKAFNSKAGISEVEELPAFMLSEELEDNPDRKWDVSQKDLSTYWENF